MAGELVAIVEPNHSGSTTGLRRRGNILAVMLPEDVATLGSVEKKFCPTADWPPTGADAAVQAIADQIVIDLTARKAAGKSRPVCAHPLSEQYDEPLEDENGDPIGSPQLKRWTTTNLCFACIDIDDLPDEPKADALDPSVEGARLGIGDYSEVSPDDSGTDKRMPAQRGTKAGRDAAGDTTVLAADVRRYGE